MQRQQDSSPERSVSNRPRRITVAARACAAMLRGYQLFLRPLWPPACRYAPSCSEYAREAFLQFGVFRGGILAVRRLGRCHSFHPGGYDPVPTAKG